MPRKLLSRFLPNNEKIREIKYIGFMGRHLQSARLWSLNRRAVAGAVSVGVFCAFMPIPFQMVLAAVVAIFMEVNLPVSLVLVWISNPITLPILFLFAYKVGAILLNISPYPLQFELSFAWLYSIVDFALAPLLLGCLVCGLVFALLGNILTRVLWWQMVLQRRRKKTVDRKSK